MSLITNYFIVVCGIGFSIVLAIIYCIVDIFYRKYKSSGTIRFKRSNSSIFEEVANIECNVQEDSLIHRAKIDNDNLILDNISLD